MQHKTSTKQTNYGFIKVVFILVFGTVLFAYYISNLMFYGKNSYEVYSTIKKKRIKLQQSITEMQKQNANLQKQYFELKNLEPEEL